MAVKVTLMDENANIVSEKIYEGNKYVHSIAQDVNVFMSYGFSIYIKLIKEEKETNEHD